MSRDIPNRRYRIVVRGEFGALLSNAFSELVVETRQGETVLMVDAIDDSELYDVLERLRDFGIDLLSLCQESAT
jgi:hypothetical protein